MQAYLNICQNQNNLKYMYTDTAVFQREHKGLLRR